MFEELVPFLVMGSLVLVYIFSYALNKRTPVPEECKDLFKDASCKSCNNFSCSHSSGGAE